MQKYEFLLTVTYSKTIFVDADDEQDAFDLACETPDFEIVGSGNSSFDCICEGEVQDA